MNKGDLINTLATKLGKTKKETEEFVGAFTETVIDTVATGDSVVLGGFGTFERVNKNERTCKNPKTGEPVLVPAKKAPKFKPAKNFKESVNK